MLAGVIIKNKTLILHRDKWLCNIIVGSFHLNWSIYQIFSKVFITKITHSISAEFCRPLRYLLFNVCFIISIIQVIFHTFSSAKVTLVITFINNHFLFLQEYRKILSRFSCVKFITFKHFVWSKKIYPFFRGFFNIFLNIKYRFTICMRWFVYLVLKLWI